MKLHSCQANRHWTRSAGFTLIEMMTSVGIGIVLLAGLAILYINGNECFVAMANYQNLDKYSCNAMDLLSKEIRGASSVTAYTAGQSISFTNAITGTGFSLTYNSGQSNLVLSGTQILADTGNSSVTNLTGCVSWYCAMYTGWPTVTTTDILFTNVATASTCKVVQMNWKCQRTYIGKGLTTESVQTAQIVLRNKAN
jgi:Tfp pilus assembly protein PilW